MAIKVIIRSENGDMREVTLAEGEKIALAKGETLIVEGIDPAEILLVEDGADLSMTLTDEIEIILANLLEQLEAETNTIELVPEGGGEPIVINTLDQLAEMQAGGLEDFETAAGGDEGATGSGGEDALSGDLAGDAEQDRLASIEGADGGATIGSPEAADSQAEPVADATGATGAPLAFEGLDDRLVARKARRTQLIHARQQHDSVVDHDPHQDQETDLRHEIHGGPGQHQRPGGSRKREQDGEQNGEGLGQRLEERGHHEVDHEEGQEQVEGELGVFLIALQGAESEVPAVSGRHLDAV